MTDPAVLREIAPGARVDPRAVVGPFCVIGPDVRIGPGTVLASRVCVAGHTVIGRDNSFAEGCVVGHLPQDLKYAGGPTMLIIGDRNVFGREVTVHVGTEQGGYLTSIGNDNVFMDGSHVAHDCYVGNGACLGRQVLLAGHIRLHDGVVIEELSGVHHFVTIGQYARIGPRTPVRPDVPPYVEYFSADCDSPPAVQGTHNAGIRAAGLSGEAERDLRKALVELFGDQAALQTKIEQLMNMGVEGEVAALCQFCQRSLQGVFGRQREVYRGQTPPEAAELLPAEIRRLLQ